jgi:hypothetical protein
MNSLDWIMRIAQGIFAVAATSVSLVVLQFAMLA